MKSIVAKKSIDKELKSNVLAIGAEARNAKKLDSSVINSTLGMFYDDNGEFLINNTVLEAFEEVDPASYLAYSSISGGDELKNNLSKWVLRQYYDTYTKDFSIASMATPGGSGALSSIISNYLDNGDTLLIPDISWGPYKIMAKEAQVKCESYKLFNGSNTFNIDSFKERVEMLAKTQNRVVVIINDPCQNPTGYTMTKAEWTEVINTLNTISSKGIPAILICDIAYVDFYAKGLDESRAMFEVFKNAHENLLITCTFSGSKTMSFYGVRFGAILALAKNNEIIDEFNRVFTFASRGKWSSTSNVGIMTFNKIVNDDKLREKFENELQLAVELLKKRGELFLSEAKECGLETYPYMSGYFVTIPNCVEDAFEILKSNGIYVIPFGTDAVRIALSGISLKDIKGLAAKVKKVQL